VHVKPFQELRDWAHDAGAGRLAGASVAGLCLVAAVAWLLVPARDAAAPVATVKATATRAPVTAGPTPGSAAPGAATSFASPATASAGGPSAAAATTTGGAAAPTATAAGRCPSGGDQGVTGDEIKVVVMVVDLAGPVANNAFNLPSADEQQLLYGAVADAVNAAGGVACRKLALQFLKVNPTDDSNKQAQCLAATSAKPFAVVDAGGYGGSNTIGCIPSHELPFFAYSLNAADQARLYPYEFGLSSTDLANRNGVLGLGQLGAFDPSKGFQKLGFIYRSCFSQFLQTMRAAQRRAGIPGDRIVEYDVGCGTAFASPADLQQAVLKFRSAGVTHVMTGEFLSDFANFTRVAQQQGFKPQWVLTDDQIPVAADGALAPDADNLDGAILVTDNRYGEENTAGFVPTAGTQRCNAIFAAKGLPPVYRQRTGFGGRACSQLWMVQAAIAHAPRLQRNALAEGLRNAGSVEQSFPYGPNDFSGERVTFGGQSWRPLRFSKDCRCWRVADAAYRPSFG
jgi:hypothetical protein